MAGSAFGRTTVASHGAPTKRRASATSETPTAAVITVRPNSVAAPASRLRSVVKIGTNGAASPAETRTSRAISGIRNAAL